MVVAVRELHRLCARRSVLRGRVRLSSSPISKNALPQHVRFPATNGCRRAATHGTRALEMNSHASLFSIPADHPSLPGHFPGNPIVPGVVLLDEVIRAAESCLARAVLVRGLPQVKFVQPLHPNESAHVSLTL